MPRIGTGRVYLRGETYWIDYSIRGKRYRESTGETDERKAQRKLNKRLGEAAVGRFIGPTEEKVMFEDLAKMIVADYKANGRRSLPRLELSLEHLRATFGESRAIDITTDRVTSYIADRQDAGAAKATIQQELAALKRAFNLAVQANRLTSRPHVPSVKVKNARQGFFTDEDLDRLAKELPEAIRPVLWFGAYTGWRKGEVLPLQWSQVDFAAGEIRLWESKNDEPRVFPFRVLPRLAALLEEQHEKTRAIERETGRIVPHVFHRQGRPIREMKGAWAEACKRAGLAGWLFHDLRRTAVRNLERAGVPRSTAMQLTGHKTESVYRRYAIVDSVALSEGVEKLAKLHGGPAEPSKVVPIQEAAAQG